MVLSDVWIAVHKPFVADGVVYKPWGHTWIGVYMPLVPYVDRRLQALDGLRGSPFTSLWWQMESFTSLWGIRGYSFHKPLVAYVDRQSQAFGGRWSHLQAFGGIRGSSFTSLWWFAWIAVHKP